MGVKITGSSGEIRGNNTSLSFGRTTKSVAGGTNVTLTANEYQYPIIDLTGLLTANINVVFPTTGLWLIYNNTTGNFVITLKTNAGTGVVIQQGKRGFIYADGTNIVFVETDKFSTQRGLTSYTMTDGNVTLNTEVARNNKVIEVFGTLTADRNVVVPTEYNEWYVRNGTSGGFNIVVKTSGGTGVTLAAGRTAMYCDGTNVVSV